MCTTFRRRSLYSVDHFKCFILHTQSVVHNINLDMEKWKFLYFIRLFINIIDILYRSAVLLNPWTDTNPLWHIRNRSTEHWPNLMTKIISFDTINIWYSPFKFAMTWYMKDEYHAMDSKSAQNPVPMKKKKLFTQLLLNENKFISL